MIRAACIAAAIALGAAPALARNPDGALDAVIAPHDGQPAIVAPGGVFEAQLTGALELRLEGPAAIALDPVFAPLPGGGVRALCTVPADAPEGAYAIAAGGDRTPRAVFVRAAFPEVYAAAHVTDTHLGSTRHPRAAADIVREVFAAVNASGAAFALVTGDLTESGTADEFRAFLAVLETCTLPTFVVPGNHDRGPHYDRFFGSGVYAFGFGVDAFLAFDTRGYVIAEDWSAQAGALERLRRAHRPARWAFGVTHRFDPAMGMRVQLALFADAPLDGLIFGHWHRENTAEERSVPWGRTPMIVTPAAIDGAFRIIDITAQGPLPRPVEKPAAVE